METKNNNDIIIIGGGASGMMCATTLLEEGFMGKIYIFDKNKRLGEKVAITGGGRCNVTTGNKKIKNVLQKYIRGASFIKYAIQNLTPTKLYKWFEDNGVKLKIEDDLRVFPISNNSKDVISLFENKFEQSTNVITKLQETVLSINKNKIKNKFTIKTDRGYYDADIIVLATGGNAYQHTGSTGDAYSRAKTLGHTVTQLAGSLSSFITSNTELHQLSGISLPQCKITFLLNGETKQIEGPLLFTHFGISGPIVFALSAHIAYQNISKQNPFNISIHIDKNKDYEFRDNLIIQETKNKNNKQIKNIIKGQITEKIIDIINKNYLNNILDNMLHSFSKKNRNMLCNKLSKIEVSLIGCKPGDEFVTAGGINTSEINDKTMESKICENLYIVGETLDVDGLTGGYNLHSSRATGKLCATSIIKKLNLINKKLTIK